MIRYAKLATALIVVATSAVLPLNGATIKRATFEEYCATATQIVRATVSAQVPVIPKAGIAHTRITLRVHDVMKGAQVQSIMAVVPGAVTPEATVLVPGAPKFKDGEEVIAFIFHNSSGNDVFLGLGSGVYRVSLDAKRGSVVTGLHADPGGEALSQFRDRVVAAMALKPVSKTK